MLVTQLCPTLCNPWTVAHQAPLSMGFSKHEYQSRWPFPPPVDLPKPRIKLKCPESPELAREFFTAEPPEFPMKRTVVSKFENLGQEIDGSLGQRVGNLFSVIRCCCSIAKSCPTLCYPMNCSMPGFPVLHCLSEFAQTHVH